MRPNFPPSTRLRCTLAQLATRLVYDAQARNDNAFLTVESREGVPVGSAGMGQQATMPVYLIPAGGAQASVVSVRHYSGTGEDGMRVSSPGQPLRWPTPAPAAERSWVDRCTGQTCGHAFWRLAGLQYLT